MQCARWLLLFLLLSVHILGGAKNAVVRPFFEYYANYQNREKFNLINAVARLKFATKHIQPFIGASYEDYSAKINSYSMSSALIGADLPLFQRKLNLRYEYKAPNSSAYEHSSKYGFYAGHYQGLGAQFIFDSYAEFFKVHTPTSDYNAATAWVQIQKNSFLGRNSLKPHVEIYYKDSLFENTMDPLKELRVGLWYQYVNRDFVMKVRSFAFSDVYNKQGFSGEFVMGGTF